MEWRGKKFQVSFPRIKSNQKREGKDSSSVLRESAKTSQPTKKRTRGETSAESKMSSTAGDNITSLLQKSQCCCLNEDLKAPHTNLFVGDHTLPLRSDADEQLLLHLGFNQTMKLSSIILGIPDSTSCPKTLKLFCNQNNLGFEDATGNYIIAARKRDKLALLKPAKWSCCS